MTKTRPAKPGRLVALLSLLLIPFLLTGCFKFTMDLEVSNQDTVSGTAVVALSKELQAFAEESGGGEEPTDVFEGVDGAEVSDFDDGSFVGQQYEFNAIPLEEFSLNDDESALKIERDGDNLVVSGNLSLEDEAADADAGEDFGFGQAFVDSADLRVTMKFPGEILETNGEVDEDTNTITWIPQYGEANEISAVVNSPRGIPAWVWWIVAGVATLVGLALLALLLSQRRKRGAGPPASESKHSPGVIQNLLHWLGFTVPNAGSELEQKVGERQGVLGDFPPHKARFSYEVPPKKNMSSLFGESQRETFQVWLTSETLTYRFLNPSTLATLAEETIEVSSILNAWYVADKRSGSVVRVEVADGAIDIPAAEAEGQTLVRMLKTSTRTSKPSLDAPRKENFGGEIVNLITQLGTLRDQGLLTNEEFETKKRDLLKRL